MIWGAFSASVGLRRKLAGTGFEPTRSVMFGSFRRDLSSARAWSLLM